MSLNELPSAERIHIVFFGRRNVGKSSVINAVTGQNLSIVSPVKGTTTDPVKKAMELLPLGPVVIVDTAGIDDEGELGEMRIKKSMEALNYADIAVLVTDSEPGKYEKELTEIFKKQNVPYIICYNKNDINNYSIKEENEISVSAETGDGIDRLKELIGRFAVKRTKPLVSDLISSGDMVILVTPIDEAAPKGRLILPQQMVLRDVLDSHAAAMVLQDGELEKALDMLSAPPKLVICDSQVFGKVSKIVPENVYLTSFSIIMLRYKLGIKAAVDGSRAIDELKDGDKILISEGCTHHRQCGDIGTVKLPEWIEKFSGKKLRFAFTSGGEFPDNVKAYSLVIHCGGCMLNETAMRTRTDICRSQGVPFTNYGVVISKIHGTLERSLEIFKK